MIFYLAVDDKGDTKIVGTQAEAKAINKDFQQIDIPVDKAGLMTWVQQMLDETLNDCAVLAEPMGSIAEVISDTLYDLLGSGGGDGDTIAEYTSRLVSLVEAEKASVTPPINPEAKPAPAPLARPLNELLNVSYIQDWLINDAKQGEIERIYNAIGCRVGEILRDAR